MDLKRTPVNIFSFFTVWQRKFTERLSCFTLKNRVVFYLVPVVLNFKRQNFMIYHQVNTVIINIIVLKGIENWNLIFSLYVPLNSIGIMFVKYIKLTNISNKTTTGHVLSK